MKNLLNLGKVLKKEEQKAINGGWRGGRMCCEWDHNGICIEYAPIGRSCAFTG